MNDPTTPSSSRPPFATTTPGPIGPSGTPADVSPAQWDAIVADLAERGAAGEPVLVSAESVTWPNGALGCPQPGMSYTQAVVDGMRVVASGLEPGDKVIVNGVQKVFFPGMPVQPTAVAMEPGRAGAAAGEPVAMK